VCSTKPVQREKVLFDDKPKGTLQAGEASVEVPFQGLETSLSQSRGAACCIPVDRATLWKADDAYTAPLTNVSQEKLTEFSRVTPGQPSTWRAVESFS
jgi:hypothetical protein